MPTLIQPKVAFESGESAKKRGFFRVSPFYEDARADAYFFAGYDGKKFEEIEATFENVVG